MNRNFADPLSIDKNRLAELSHRTNGPGLRRLLVQSAAYLASAAAMMTASERGVVALWLVVNGVVQFGMFGMLHESCHQTPFRSRGLNLLAGWVAALAHPMSPALMRAFHFEHHRHTHDLARDPELAGLPFMVNWPRHVVWIGTMTGLPILLARVGWTVFAAFVPASGLWDRVLPFVKPARRRRIAWEARALCVVHAAIIGAAFAWYRPLLLLYAGMWIGHALTAIYTTCEHRGLAEGGTILERTRSLVAPGWLRWLLWNMPYHAEHHGWPAVPFHRLGARHDEVGPQLVHRESVVYLHLHGGRERAEPR